MSTIPTTFGIPISNGNLLSEGDHGFIVSFNLKHLFIQRLLGGQVYSDSQQPLSSVIKPTTLPLIFQYPLSESSPDFAIVQKEFSTLAFFRSPKYTYNDKFRVVFWFQRSVIPVENDNDLIDTPDEYIPLVIALTKKSIFNYQGIPVPSELEQEISIRSQQLKQNGNLQNYYVRDTFNMSNEDIEKVSWEKELIDDSNLKSKNIDDSSIETQRSKIINYLIENGYNTRENLYQRETKALAREITEFLYPFLKGNKQTKKIDVIRHELDEIKMGKIQIEPQKRR